MGAGVAAATTSGGGSGAAATILGSGVCAATTVGAGVGLGAAATTVGAGVGAATTAGAGLGAAATEVGAGIGAGAGFGAAATIGAGPGAGFAVAASVTVGLGASAAGFAMAVGAVTVSGTTFDRASGPSPTRAANCNAWSPAPSGSGMITNWPPSSATTLASALPESRNSTEACGAAWPAMTASPLVSTRTTSNAGAAGESEGLSAWAALGDGAGAGFESARICAGGVGASSLASNGAKPPELWMATAATTAQAAPPPSADQIATEFIAAFPICPEHTAGQPQEATIGGR